MNKNSLQSLESWSQQQESKLPKRSFQVAIWLTKVTYEMNCRTLLPSSGYDISAAGKETSEQTKKT